MNLTILAENSVLPGRFLTGENGISVFIEDENTKILFNTGYSGVLIKNSYKLNIDLFGTDYIVISGGFMEQVRGLVPLVNHYTEGLVEDLNYKKPSVIAHPEAFGYRVHPSAGESGSLINEDMLRKHFRLILEKEPYRISEKLFFLGEVKRRFAFENFSPIGKLIDKDKEAADRAIDESALVYMGKNGLVIFTGNAFSGICNIVEHAREVTGEERVTDVIGGFNLLYPGEEQIGSTMEYFKKLRPMAVHPCFNTGLKSKIALSTVVRVKETGTGLKLSYV